MKFIKLLNLFFRLMIITPISIFSSPEIYGVILAGGSGKRLWPLSRMKKPKQFIPLHHNKTLLESTIDRINPLASKGCVWVVTTEEHQKSVRHYGAHNVDKILSEPDSRNTAPALLMTALEIYKENPDAIIFFVPADHYIPDNTLFRSSLMHAITHASNNDNIVLLGIQPHRPSTEYGYIEYCDQITDHVFKVKNFHEKPNSATASKYLSLDTMLWNTGIFCAKASLFIEEFTKHTPSLVENMHKALNKQIPYSQLPEDSFDKAVLEKSDKCVVVPSCFKWSDVGNLEQFILAKQEKIESDKIISHKSTNNLVDSPNKLTVLIDVHDLCIIETDDVLLISRKSETDSVKDVISTLKANGFTRYIE